jgi:oligopeptide transport system ATP-binding protein
MLLQEIRIESRTLLKVTGLKKYFPATAGISEFLRPSQRKYIKAVDDISFEIPEGRTFGLVGESGCGKTTTSKVILGLYKPTSGNVFFGANDVHGHLPGEVRRGIHRDIQAVFQDPAASLDPRMRIGRIIEEPLVIHQEGDSGSRREVAFQMLEAVGLRNEFYLRYPHELSGGQQQRVAIARALTLHPKLVILDEPVSALDMSVRAQVLNLLKDLQTQFKLTYLFVAHDLSVVRYMCDQIAVMYLGKIVESSSTKEIFENPLHPYTRALLDAVPIPDPENTRVRTPLSGGIPSSVNLPSGCRFRTRCPAVMDICSKVEPNLAQMTTGHYVACHLYPTYSEPSSDTPNP